MTSLLDTNVLLALALGDHEFHARVVRWLRPGRRGERTPVATCPMTELGFVRILNQPSYAYSIQDGKRLLKELKSIPDLEFTFLADDQSALDLPPWVSKRSQVTDGHLMELARKHRVRLVTLDHGIPGAFLIPA